MTGFWTYGDADKHQCNDKCWCNGQPKRKTPKAKGVSRRKGK